MPARAGLLAPHEQLRDAAKPQRATDLGGHLREAELAQELGVAREQALGVVHVHPRHVELCEAPLVVGVGRAGQAYALVGELFEQALEVPALEPSVFVHEAAQDHGSIGL